MARRLKRFVIPTGIGVLAITTLVTVPLIVGNNKIEESGHRYTISEIKERILPVVNEVETIKPMKPFLEETITKNKDYYRKDDDEQTQNLSLIYYEKTYMPSTGILYSGDESFEVVASLDGIVKEIGEDNILGKYIVIEHKDGYKTRYYSLSEINVSENTSVIKGDVIGTGGPNKIDSSTKYNILFETYHDGFLMDPEDFYNVDFRSNN